MGKRLTYWRRISGDYIYAEYRDDDYVPGLNPLDLDRHGKPRSHGQRCSSSIMRICDFEARRCIFVHEGDDNGDNYHRPKNIDPIT